MKIVAKAAGVHEKDIIGHDLFLYVHEKGTVLGADKEYVSAPHLDDLQCGFGNLQGFLQASKSASIPMLVIFDDEEVGSSTKQGANSTFLEDTMHIQQMVSVLLSSVRSAKHAKFHCRSLPIAVILAADRPWAIFLIHMYL